MDWTASTTEDLDKIIQTELATAAVKKYDEDREKNDKQDTAIEISQEESPNTISEMFAAELVSNPRDQVILVIGILFSIIHGASFPILALLIGNVSETFIAQSREGYSNSSEMINQNVSKVMGSSRTTLASNVSLAGIAGNVSSYSSNPLEFIFDGFAYLGRLFGLSSTTSVTLTVEEFGDRANSFSWYFVGLAIIVLASTYIQTWCWESIADKQTSLIRRNFISQMLRQENEWFESHPPGFLIAKLTDDLERYRDGLGYKLGLVIEYFSCFGIGAFFGFCINAKLTLMFGLSVPFILGRMNQFISLFVAKAVDRQEKYGQAGSVAQEVMAEIRTVAAFGKELEESRRYKDILSKTTQQARTDYHTIGVSTGYLYVIVYISFGLAFLFASNQLLQNHISRQEVYTVFTCGTVAILALTNILPCMNDIAYSQGCLESFSKIMIKQPPVDPYSDEGIQPYKFSGSVKFFHIMFSYPRRKDTLVIRDFNLTVTPGVPIGIIGSSGEGKSTLVDLLIRFNEPNSGSITFDDFQLDQLNVRWLRDNVGVVDSTPTFMADTIYNNIISGQKNIKPEDVVRAAIIAGAHDFIMTLPNKYGTIVGEGSRELPSGLRQLIALARLLVRKPKVIILDESFSSLNYTTIRNVLKNLKTATAKSTLIMFSHNILRLQMDGLLIHVLKGGQIVESGLHDELLAKRGVYYEMGQKQSVVKEIPDTDSKIEQAAESAVQERMGRESGSDDSEDEESDAKRYLKKMNRLKTRDKMNVYLGILGCIICGLVPPIGALGFCQLLITFAETGDELSNDANFWMKIVFSIGVAAGLGYWMRMAFISSLGEMISSRVRKIAYLTILRQDISWFDDKDHTPDRLYNILSRHVPVFKVAIGGRLGVVMSAIISYMAAIIISFFFDWRLALVVVIIILIQIFVIYTETQVYEKLQVEIFDKMDDAFSIAAEAIKDIKTIQSLNLQAITLNKFTDATLEFQKSLSHVTQHIGISFGISEALSFVTFAAIFRVGAYLIDSRSMEPINVFKIFIVLVFSTFTIGQVTSFIPDYVKSKLAYRYLFTYCEAQANIFDFMEETAGQTPVINGQITFKDVYYSYEKEIGTSFLLGLSFELPAGSFLGICGSIGKSTILYLLLRFYKCDSGQVMIDGVDVKNINVSHLRSKIGYVAQYPNLLNRTIWDNIVYGYQGDLKGQELMDLVKGIAQELHLTEFIDDLPDGYDTIVGQFGSGLTVGEQQRITIARALIRDPKILLLDMPTSALDPELEIALGKALKKIAKGRTCILISNRTSVIQLTDYVAVLQNGKVAEYGTHEELKELNGAYCHFMEESKMATTSSNLG